MFLSRYMRLSFLSKVSNSNFVKIYAEHTTPCFYTIDKVSLSKLRKNTGFSLSLCKSALEENENDLEKAETWLLKEAKKHGWAKIAKLGTRATPQGLIGVFIDRNVGGLVEVNCETDFVAKNQDFRQLVNTITKEVTLSEANQTADSLSKTFISKEELEKMQTSEGKNLTDLIALSVGKIGENIQLSRAVKIVSPPDVQLLGYVHPPNEDGELIGKYATVAAFQNANDEQLTRQICAHIVGMNPTEVGTFEDLEETSTSENEAETSTSSENEADSSIKKEKETVTSTSSSDDSGDETEEEVDIEEEEETSLLRQKFLTDQESTVGQILKENDMNIIDFVRLECGETQKEL